MNNRSKVLDILEEGRKKLIEEHEKQVEEHKRELAELDRVIDRIKSGPPQTKEQVVAKYARKFAGILKGMSLPDSIHTVLIEGPMPFEKLVETLKIGGVKLGDPEKPNRYAANVKTTIANNRSRFRYDKRKDTVQLLRPQAV